MNTKEQQPGEKNKSFDWSIKNITMTLHSFGPKIQCPQTGRIKQTIIE